jgi:hypothetical protein
MRALLLVVFMTGCLGTEAQFANVCDQANDVVQRCGATVPMLANAPCTGIARFVSQCVADQVRGCDELATLMRNADRCFPDAGDDAFPEAEALPFPAPHPLDGGTAP